MKTLYDNVSTALIWFLCDTWIILESNFLFSDKQDQGGTTIVRWYGNMCPGQDPPFSGQSALPSLPIYYQRAAHMTPGRAYDPNFKFKKILHFQH